MRIGNYDIVKQIGEGGFARTYLAKHALLKTPACVKQNLELTKDDEKLLLAEAKLLWNVHHHSLPTLKDYVKCPDGSYAMVMSFIKGMELFKLREKVYPRGLDPEHVCWIMQRVLNALHYLHFFGIIHGDVKPHNIIIQPEEHNAVLVDYGLSTIKPNRISRCVGYTPVYSAPEQVAGTPPIPETDFYCVGLTAMFILGGDPQAKTMPKSVPKPLRDLVESLCLYSPTKRPKDARQIVSKLSEVRQTVFGRRVSNKTLTIR
jgi:serine/threonine protein kinase